MEHNGNLSLVGDVVGRGRKVSGVLFPGLFFSTIFLGSLFGLPRIIVRCLLTRQSQFCEGFFSFFLLLYRPANDVFFSG